MSAQTVLYESKANLDYVTDQGTILNLNSRFRAPSDFTDDIIDNVLNCVDAVRRTETKPCAEQATVEPRKIIVRRSNGNSFGLNLSIRSQAVEAAQCLWDLLQTTSFPAVCIELVGEHSLNLIDELSSADKSPPEVAPIISPDSEKGKNTLYYSAVMRQYKADARFGQNVLMPFKSQTNVADAPYTELQDYFGSCVEPVTSATCSGATAITYRRYVPSFLTSLTYNVNGEQGDQVQTVTVPAIGNETDQIKACGQLLTRIPSVICLEYFGESNKRLHKLINK